MFPSLRRICVVGRADAMAPTQLDIRVFNLQTRINYICFDLTVEDLSQQAANLFCHICVFTILFSYPHFFLIFAFSIKYI